MNVIMPFNFQPTATTTFAAESYSYTVPTGKIALVSYCLNTSAQSRPNLADNNATTGAMLSNKTNGWMILMAGDSLTRSVSAPSGTATFPAQYLVTPYAILNVNSNPVAKCYSYGFFKTGFATTYYYDSTATADALIAVYAS